MDKTIFAVSLFMIVTGIAGQLAWLFFAQHLFQNATPTVASFQEMQNASGYMMLIGFLLLPAGLFKDGLPIPGPGAKVAIGIILVIFVGVGFTGLLVLPSAHTTGPLCTKGNCAIVTILHGSGENPNALITFSPKTITVILGVNNTVQWYNNDTSFHTVHGVTLSALASSTFGQGQTFTYTFTAAGNFSYFCTIHTYMKGTVIVLSHG